MPLNNSTFAPKFSNLQTFKDLGLSDPILKALENIGFETPTEIQVKAISELLQKDSDLMGLAQTGTGKTAAFALPLLDLIDPATKHTQAVILAPTRELAQQIANEIDNFSKHLGKINTYVVYGGTNISTQIKDIKRKTPHILIATPGRLIDLIKRKVVNLQQISYLVLDEADEMLNMGFQEDIDTILKGTPDEIRTWLFSATMPKEIRSIVENYMTDPIEVSVDQKNVTNQNIEHKYVLVDRRNKADAVKRLIDYMPDIYGVIFCRTKMDTQDLADELGRDGYRAEAIHGDLSQGQRDKVMKRFRKGVVNLLVATDVAARGIDVNDLTHVIHYTLPDSPAYYTHRSGRTARAGKSGVSLTILIPKDKNKLRRIERELKINFEKVELPKYEELQNKRIDNWIASLVEKDTEAVNDEIFDQVNEALQGLEKEDIIKKLIAIQLDKTKKKSSNTDDLNLEEYGRRDSSSKKRSSKSEGRRDRDRKRSIERREGRNRRDNDDDRKNRRSKRRDDNFDKMKGGKYTKMYINIGKMDKMSVGDLVEFISKNGNVKRKAIGDIAMSKMHTIFEVEKENAKSLSRYFKNIQFNGRDIRCNEN